MKEQLVNESSNVVEIENQNKFKEAPKNFIQQLTYKQRLAIFIVLNILGYILQLGSLKSFYNSLIKDEPISFAVYYSLGNILSLTGTIILVGIEEQLKVMQDKERRMISFVFLVSLIASLIIPLTVHNSYTKFLTLLFVAIQMVSYFIYTLSFFPTIRSALKQCLACCVNLVKRQIFKKQQLIQCKIKK